MTFIDVTCRRLSVFTLILTFQISGIAIDVYASGTDSSRGEDDSPLEFMYGDNCSHLFDLPQEVLRDVSAPRNHDSFGYFCRADADMNCDDYAGSIADLGYLSSNGFFCAFIPIGNR